MLTCLTGSWARLTWQFWTAWNRTWSLAGTPFGTMKCEAKLLRQPGRFVRALWLQLAAGALLVDLPTASASSHNVWPAGAEP
jgi:hypothetical protein